MFCFMKSTLNSILLLPIIGAGLFLSHDASAINIQDTAKDSKFWAKKSGSIEESLKEDGFQWVSKNKRILFSNNKQRIMLNDDNKWVIDEAKIHFSHNNTPTFISLLIGNTTISLDKIKDGLSDLTKAKTPTKAFKTIENQFVGQKHEFYNWHNQKDKYHCTLEIVIKQEKPICYKIHIFNNSTIIAFNNYLKSFETEFKLPTEAALRKNVVREKNTVVIQEIPMVIAEDSQDTSFATTTRLMNYYNVSLEKKEIADLFKANGNFVSNWKKKMDEVTKFLYMEFKNIEEFDLFNTECVREIILKNYNTKVAENAKKIKKTEARQTFLKDYRIRPKDLIGTNNFTNFLSQFDKQSLKDTRVENYGKLFATTIRNNINKGTPLIWITNRQLLVDNRGAQSNFYRLIVGFKTERSKFFVLYTSPTGYKKVKSSKDVLDDVYEVEIEEAITITRGLFTVQPIIQNATEEK